MTDQEKQDLLDELIAANQRLRQDLEQLIAAVGDMRHAQTEYFRTQSRSALSAAKAAEKKLDKLLAAIKTKPLW